MMPIKDSKIIFCSQFTLFNSVNKSMVIPRNLFYNLADSSVIYIILSLNPPPVANSVKNNTEMPQQNGVSKLTPVSETISADLLLFLGFVSHDCNIHSDILWWNIWTKAEVRNKHKTWRQWLQMGPTGRECSQMQETVDPSSLYWISLKREHPVWICTF